MHNTVSKSVFNIFKAAELPKISGFKPFPPSFPHYMRIGYSYSVVFHTYRTTHCIKIPKNGYNTNIQLYVKKCGKAVENAEKYVK